MHIKQSVNQKEGSLITPYKEPLMLKNLSSMISTNSHGYPEIKLDSSYIYFSGSENFLEKMKVISTKFELEVNYN